MHEVRVLCSCPDIDHCRTEIYVSDVRIAKAQLELQEDEFRRVLSGLLKRISALERR